jgi:tetratricopeptide (TPR) repeat protein
MTYLPSPRSIHRYFAVYTIVLLSIGLLPFQIRNREDLQDLSGFIGSIRIWRNAVNPLHSHQGDEQARQLAPGRPIERELSGGQSHTYQIRMTSGQFLYVEVDQRGIDVVVALFAPDGEKRTEVDIPYGTAGSEIVRAIAEAAGTYRIEVRALERTAEPGRYEIRVGELREATAEDRYRVAAGSVFREAEQLNLEIGTLEAKRKSIEKYHEALELYRRSGDRRGEADTLNNIGTVYYTLEEMRKALEKYHEALPIFKAVGERSGESDTLQYMCRVYYFLGETQKALEKCNESQSIFRAIDERSGEALRIGQIGLIYHSSGELRKALDKYNEALLISRAIGDREDEGTLLGYIGAVYDLLDEKQKALENYNEALSISLAVGNRSSEAATLNNIGTVYLDLGDMQQALDKYNEALSIYRATGLRRGEVYTLNNIGGVYRELGELQKALEKYNEALPISRAMGDPRAEAGSLINIGGVYISLGEMGKALEKLDEAHPISRNIGDRRVEATVLHYIGQANFSLGDVQKALENYNDALSIRRAIGERMGEAAILQGIAQVKQKLGDLAQARQSIEQAISIVESLRANISNQELRASFFASRQGFYQSYIDALMLLHKQNPGAEFDAAALAVSERARARSLLELLTGSRTDIRQGVDSSLLERKRALQLMLSAKATAQIKLLTGNHTAEQTAAVAKEIASITAEYEDLEAQIRKSNPRYEALTRLLPLNLSEIQQQVLDPETLLLEYWLGEDASYLFVVSNTSITSHQLPKRAEIEAATRQVRELLTAPQPRRGDSSITLQARIRKARADYWPQAAALSRMLLSPAARQLGAKRLLIVADGALQYLPFGALPVPERLGDVEGSLPPERNPPRPPVALTPLIVEHEIVHLPSASTLAVLRRELAGRKPAPKAVAVIADPVFSSDDARVKSPALDRKVLASNRAPSELTRALTDVRGELSRLLMTRDEAQAILSFTPQNARLEALDFRASHATSTSDELSQYRIIHFATHGLLNSQHPQLSGLVLSLVNERGEPQDGFLQLHEIFNLRLPAELVVLSACQTGLGKEIKGEGLVGLTRGFMYAGAARVAASLWKVDDAATAELMKRFYGRMLREGMRPAAALRAAQIEMWKRPKWGSPYYWGAFVLQGEWK